MEREVASLDDPPPMIRGESISHRDKEASLSLRMSQLEMPLCAASSCSATYTTPNELWIHFPLQLDAPALWFMLYSGRDKTISNSSEESFFPSKKYGRWHPRNLHLNISENGSGSIRLDKIDKSRGEGFREINITEMTSANIVQIDEKHAIDIASIQPGNETVAHFIYGAICLQISIERKPSFFVFSDAETAEKWLRILREAAVVPLRRGLCDDSEKVDMIRDASKVASLLDNPPNASDFVDFFLKFDGTQRKVDPLLVPPCGGRLRLVCEDRVERWEVRPHLSKRGVVIFRRRVGVSNALMNQFPVHWFADRRNMVDLRECELTLSKPWVPTFNIERIDTEGKRRRIVVECKTLETRVMWQEWFVLLGAKKKLSKEDEVIEEKDPECDEQEVLDNLSFAHEGSKERASPSPSVRVRGVNLAPITSQRVSSFQIRESSSVAGDSIATQGEGLSEQFSNEFFRRKHEVDLPPFPEKRRKLSETSLELFASDKEQPGILIAAKAESKAIAVPSQVSLGTEAMHPVLESQQPHKAVPFFSNCSSSSTSTNPQQCEKIAHKEEAISDKEPNQESRVREEACDDKKSKTREEAHKKETKAKEEAFSKERNISFEKTGDETTRLQTTQLVLATWRRAWPINEKVARFSTAAVARAEQLRQMLTCSAKMGTPVEEPQLTEQLSVPCTNPVQEEICCLCGFDKRLENKCRKTGRKHVAKRVATLPREFFKKPPHVVAAQEKMKRVLEMIRSGH